MIGEASFAVDALRHHRAEQASRRLQAGDRWTDLDLVIERGDGRPVHPGSLTKAFAGHVERLGLGAVRLHDLRHGVANTLLEANVHPKVVSEILGHSSTAFTMDTYQHLLPSMGAAAASAIQAALGAVGQP